jgi:putative peptidoglycan lipid II flippase
MNNKSLGVMVVVSIILLITKLSGLLRDAIVVSFYGVSSFSDGFFLALSIVLTLYGLIGKAITLYLIPKFRGHDDDYALIKTFILKGTCFSMVINLYYQFFSDSIIHFFYSSNIDKSIHHLFSSSVYSLIFIPSIYALIAYHQSQNKFYKTMIIGLMFNLAIIITIVVFNYMGQLFFVIAMGLQLLILLNKVNIRKIVTSQVLKLDIKSFYPITAIAITMAFEQLNVLLDRKFISQIGLGDLTVLDLGSKVSFMFMGIIVLSLTTVIYPKLVVDYNNKSYFSMQKIMYNSMLLLGLLSIFCIVIIRILAIPIVDILFVRGKLGASYSSEIAMYLRVYALTLLPLSLREIIVRFLILRGKETLLLSTSVLCLALNVYFSIMADIQIDIVYGSVYAITFSTFLLGVFFLNEMRKFRNEIN